MCLRPHRPSSVPPAFDWNIPAPQHVIDTDNTYTLSSISVSPLEDHVKEANNAITILEGQIEECNQVVAREEDRIRELRRQIRESQLQIKLTKRKKVDLLTSLQEYQSSRAPLVTSRIPAEVLSEVFQYYIADSTCSPWTLTQICRIWRQVAFNTPRLWGNLSILPQGSRTGTRYDNGREKCITVEHLHRALQRAKQAPLDIVFHTQSYPRPTMDELVAQRGTRSSDRREKVWEMLDMIGGEKMSQWCSLDLHISSGMNWGDYWEGKVSLKNLESLAINSTIPQLLTLVDRTSTKLRYLRFPGSQAEQWKSFTRFGALEELNMAVDLYCRWYSSNPPTLMHAAPILNQVNQVKQLQLVLSTEDFTMDSSVLFPQATSELRIQSSLQEWNRIIQPSSHCLKYLEINQTALVSGSVQGSIILPVLHHLKVIGKFAFPAIIMLSCPQLDTLEVVSCFDEVVADNALKSIHRYIIECNENDKPNPFPIRRFAFLASKASDQPLADLLCQLSNLEELSLRMHPLPKTFFSTLSAASHMDGVLKLVSCPKLKRARFDMDISSDDKGILNWTEVFPILKEMVRVRARLGVPLEILDFPKFNGEGPIAAVAAEQLEDS